jgi:tetratricopeptide (TPR) repeat protein
MRVLKSKVRHLYYFISVLLVINPGFILSQDPGNYSEFRTEITSLFLDYKLEEALALCKKFDESDREVIAAKSICYSLMGNMDKNESIIEKGFTLLKPFSSQKDDYNILAAFAISYGIQANHSGLKEKTKLAQLSVRHCKDALKLNPNLPHPNFILGRFYFELSEMSKVTAEIAKSILDKEEIERASYELALSYLVRASKSAPTRFLYNYYTGAAYDKSGNEKMAMQYFQKADKNVRHTADDRKADKDLAKQLK